MPRPQFSLRTIFWLVVVVGALQAQAGSGSVAAEPMALLQKSEFINLAIPSLWRNKNPVLVLHATKTGTIVALCGQWHGRTDVQVIEVTGDKYQFVRTNGDGVTRVERSVLCAAARGQDGRLWIVAEHSQLQNPIEGNQYCCYVLENERWDPVGARFGAPQEQSQNFREHGLHFLGDNRPVAVSIDPRLRGDMPVWRLRLRRLEAERWVTVPGFAYAFDRDPHSQAVQVVWRDQDAWLIGSRRDRDGRTVLDARWVKSVRRADVAGPFNLDSWAGTTSLFHFAVSPGGSIAVIGYEAEVEDIGPETPFFVKCYHPDGKRGFKAEQLPIFPEPVHAIDAMAWSPTGVLHAVRHDGKRIYVHRYSGRDWHLAAEGKDNGGPGTIVMESHLFFRDDGLPIVTWETFTQVD